MSAGAGSFGLIDRRNGVMREIMQRDPDQARIGLLIQRIRAVCAKDYPLRTFFRAEVSRLAVACGLRAQEAGPR